MSSTPPFLNFLKTWWLLIGMLVGGAFTAGGIYYQINQLSNSVTEINKSLDSLGTTQINKDAAQWRSINEIEEKIDKMVSTYKSFEREVRGSVNPQNMEKWGAIQRDVDELKKDVREMRMRTRGLKPKNDLNR